MPSGKGNHPGSNTTYKSTFLPIRRGDYKTRYGPIVPNKPLEKKEAVAKPNGSKKR